MDAHEGPGPHPRARSSLGRARPILLLALVLLASGCSKSNDSGTITPSAGITASTTPTAAATTPSATATAAASPSASPSRSPSPTAKPSVTASATPKVTPTISISEASGSTKNVKVGQVLSLLLPEDAGYVWAFSTKPDAGVLAVTGDQTTTVSSGAAHRFTFQAAGAGTTTFAVVETKPSETSALHNYALTVVVS